MAAEMMMNSIDKITQKRLLGFHCGPGNLINLTWTKMQNFENPRGAPFFVSVDTILRNP